jgi:hypothetical protein
MDLLLIWFNEPFSLEFFNEVNKTVQFTDLLFLLWEICIEFYRNIFFILSLLFFISFRALALIKRFYELQAQIIGNKIKKLEYKKGKRKLKYSAKNKTKGK